MDRSHCNYVTGFEEGRLLISNLSVIGCVTYHMVNIQLLNLCSEINLTMDENLLV